MPQASVLANFLLLSLTVAAVSSASVPDEFLRADEQPDDDNGNWFEKLGKSVNLETHETEGRVSDRRAEDATSGDEQLVIENRSGVHVFRMHHGRVVSAQLGVNRVYTVRETLFVSKLCTCDLRRTPGYRRVCLRSFKPAFYALVALGSLLAVFGLAVIWQVVRSRCIASRAGAAQSLFSDGRAQLLATEIGEKLGRSCPFIATPSTGAETISGRPTSEADCCQQVFNTLGVK